MIEAQAGAAVQEHVAAFNEHDTARLLAGLTSDVTWVTGKDNLSGRNALTELFDEWLWSLDPSLTLLSVVANEQQAAAELLEQLTVDGERRSMHIAAFFTVQNGCISSVKIYREGIADVG